MGQRLTGRRYHDAVTRRSKLLSRVGRPSATRVVDVRVDDRGIFAKSGREAILDVTFDGRRVWSFWLHRDGVPQDHGHLVSWPRNLAKYLNGTTDLALVESSTGETVYAETVQLGEAPSGERVAVQNADGMPLSLDKSLRLVQTFETRSDAQVEPLLDAIDTVLGALRRAGIDAFLAYGTALGAIREGKLIGHDSDADLGYVSVHTHPVDVIRESFELQRRLAAMGFRITRYSAAAIKVHVREADGMDRGLDVFGGFLRDGELNLMGEISVPYRREWIFPLGEARLEGRPFPVPADTDKFLTATYGPHWRSPDPAFKFTTPLSTQRKFNGWFRGIRMGRAGWDQFYSKTWQLPPPDPSSLVRFLLDREPEAGTVIDIGCGRGADVALLAERGVRAIGLDFQPRSYALMRERLADDSRAEFQLFNLLEIRHVLAISAWVARQPPPRHVLCRHLLESLDKAGRAQLWRATQTMLAGTDGRVYLEFCVRRGADGFAKSIGVRRSRRPPVMQAEIEAAGGRVLSSEVGPISDAPRATRVCRMVIDFGANAERPDEVGVQR